MADSTPRFTEAYLPEAAPNSGELLGGDTSGGASFSSATTLAEVTVQMVGHLKDWFSEVPCSLLYFLSSFYV